MGIKILTAGKTVNFTNGTTQTITTLTGEGTPDNIITIQSVTAGSAFTLSIASGAINKYHYSIDTTLSADTFTTIESTNVSGNTGWVFSNIDLVIIYPKSETVIINSDVTFTWSALAGTQTHYDLDYSTNGIVWSNYANKVESAANQSVVTPGTLSSRIYYWRVRVYSRGHHNNGCQGKQVLSLSRTPPQPMSL